VAQARGVSEQQARNYRIKLKSLANSDKDFARLKTQVKALNLSFLESESDEHEK
jgi:hypothetical protein